MRSKRGVTLVEVMLAGAITAMLALAVMQGVIVSVKICHENSELLAAEAYAWDTAWKWLNKKDEEIDDSLDSSAEITFYPNANGFSVASNDCPVIYRDGVGGAAKCYVSVRRVEWLSGAETMRAKRIDVDVEWGSPGDRRCLNQLVSTTEKTYNVPITLYKCSIDRGK